MNKKRIKIILVMTLMLIEIIVISLTIKSFSNKPLNETKEENKINKKQFSMYIKNSEGNYEEYTTSNYFPEGYNLNLENSICVDNNGNEIKGLLSGNGNNVTVTSNKTAFCYLYFDLITAFAVYSADDTSLTFYKNDDVVNVGDTYNNKAVTAVYTGIEEDTYTYDRDTKIATTPWFEYAGTITTVVVEDEIKPLSTATWFADFNNTTSVDITKLDTSLVTDMSHMFRNVGADVTSVEIKGLSNLDTSNVANMTGTLEYIGRNSTTFEIDLSEWNTSNVTNMYGMLAGAGQYATTWDVGDLSGWDTSQVTDMFAMFSNAGRGVTTSFTISGITNWNTENVTNMSNMFIDVGYNASEFKLDLSGWDTSEVTDMSMMFNNIGRNATTWSIGDLSKWDTGKVTSMRRMFWYAGMNTTSWSIGDLSNWNTSEVTDMSYMFNWSGAYATTFNIGDISSWNTSKVTDMSYMFNHAGTSATYTLDLSGWKVPLVTSYDYFNNSVGNKVKPPVWVN